MSFSAKPDAPEPSFTDGPLPCIECRVPMPRSMLAVCGARCADCYRTYCAARQPFSIAQSVLPEAIGRLAWAQRLRECELHRGGLLPNGRRMTPLQRDAWHSALHEPVQDDPDETLRQLDARQRSTESVAVLLMVEKGQTQ